MTSSASTFLMSSLTRLRWRSTPTVSLIRFRTFALTATCASRSSSSKWIESMCSWGTSSRTSGGPVRSCSSRRSYCRYSRSASLLSRSAWSAGRVPSPWPLGFRVPDDPFPLREDPLWPRRVPERCELVVFVAISASSSSASEVLHALLRALAEPLDALLRALTDAGHALAGASADLLDGAPRALPGAPHDLAGVGQEVVRA